MLPRRYLVVALNDDPPQSMFGRTIVLDSRHTILGDRAYMESAVDLAQRGVDTTGSSYRYAMVLDRDDGFLAVAEVEREDAR